MVVPAACQGKCPSLLRKLIENCVAPAQPCAREFVRTFAMIAGAKARLRQQVRDRLDAISREQGEAAAPPICARLPPHAVWKSAGSILFFAPLPSEPDIWPLLKVALAAGKTVALPRFSPQTESYSAGVVQNPQTDLQRGQFGIRERSEERRVGKECRSRWAPY